MNEKISGLWEYVAVYVENLTFAMKDPAKFTKLFVEKYKYKLKGTGYIAFHLGCDFCCDARIRYSSPLEKGNHLELDISELLHKSGTH